MLPPSSRLGAVSTFTTSAIFALAATLASSLLFLSHRTGFPTRAPLVVPASIWSATELPDLQPFYQADEGQHSSALLCIVGGLRSFALEEAHGSIHRNVFSALSSTASVDVNMFLVYEMDSQSTGAKQGAQPCYDNVELSKAIQSFKPQVVRIIRRSTCEEFDKAWKSSHCTSSKGHRQISLVHKCFTERKHEYAYYIRVRPDSFFAKPIPALDSIDKHAVTTWLKHDAPGSDQFFIFPHLLFHSWWQRIVKQKVDFGTFSCCPEYEMFHGQNVSQRRDIYGCLLRSSHELSCWRNSTYSIDAIITENLATYPKQQCRDSHPNFTQLIELLGNFSEVHPTT